MALLLCVSLFSSFQTNAFVSSFQTNALGYFAIPGINGKNPEENSNISTGCPPGVSGAFKLKIRSILRRSSTDDTPVAKVNATDDSHEGADLNIQQLPVFASLLPSDVERLMSKLERVESDEGAVIIAENDKDNDMYFISEGELECYLQNKPKRVVKILGPGDNVGELALFFGTPRALSVRTKSKKAVLWKLTKDAFDSSIKDTDISDDDVLSLLKRAYSDEKEWINLPKIAFADGMSEASWERPHTHAGKFEAYSPNKLLVENLDAQAEKVLNEGGLYKHYLDAKDFNRCLVIQDIEAPHKTVLSQIVDYNDYSQKVPQTLESELYKTKTNDAVDSFAVRLKTGMRGLSMEFFVKSEYHKKHNSVVWSLDYDKLSEIDEAKGYWRAEPHPSSPDEKTRLYYSVDMSLGSRVSGVVASYINKKAATDAVAWVKKSSERWHQKPKK